MKNTLLFLFASLLFIGCSNDPDDTVQEEQEEQAIEFKIKTFKIDYTDSSETTTFSFDENGRKTKTTFNREDGETSEYQYIYNDDGKFKRMINLYDEGLRIVWKFDFEYQSDGKISRIGYVENPENLTIPSTNYEEFMYVDNKIITDNPQFFYESELTFNQENKLILYEVASHWVSSKVSYEYIGNNLVTIKDLGSMDEARTTYTITYDNELNPLYPDFKNNLDVYLYSLPVALFKVMRNMNHFSENNFTKIEITSANGNTQIIEKETLYNEAGYPISAMVSTDGILSSELTYEYY